MPPSLFAYIWEGDETICVQHNLYAGQLFGRNSIHHAKVIVVFVTFVYK